MIPVSEPSLTGNELKYVMDAIKSGWISSKGDYIKRFEKKFSETLGGKFAVSCSNGTSALHLALLVLGIKDGDEVIVPIFSFVATANVIKYVNAKPVFIDCNDTWTIDPEKIEEKITPRTKAIIPVHLYGIPCNMDKIMEIAKKYNLYVIEDCAEAVGAEFKGKKIGTFGDIGCFSFFANKIITTGEGGLCITKNEELKEKMEILRDHGMSKTRKYWHPIIGYNYRLTNIQAAIGLAQLEQLEKFLKIREEHNQLYEKLLLGLKDIEFIPKIQGSRNVYWMHCFLVNNKDGLANYLRDKGVDTRPLFFPLNEMPPYNYDKERYPHAERISKHGINLPSSTNLTEDQIKEICGLTRAFFNGGN